MLYDAVSSEFTELSRRGGKNADPSIVGRSVIWSHNPSQVGRTKPNGCGELLHYDLTSGGVASLTGGLLGTCHYQISGRRVSFTGIGAESGAYFHDLDEGNTYRISSHDYVESIAVRGNFIAWPAGDEGQRGVYTFDVSTSTSGRISDASDDQRNVTLTREFVYWTATDRDQGFESVLALPLASTEGRG